VTRNAKLLVAASTALVVIAAAVGVTLAVRARRRASALAALDAAHPAQALEVGALPPTPSVWVDVRDPAAVWKAARANGWLQKALAEPLGQGFAAGWAGFLGTRGTDLAGAFEGTVTDLLVGKVLADPFRVVYLGGSEATGAPAVLVPKPSSASRSAYALLDRAARNGSYQAARCPGAGEDLPEKLLVSRWLVADHAVFAGARGDALALGKSPLAVIQALCADLPGPSAEQGVALTVSVARDGLGREALLGAALLGLGPVTRFEFALAADRLVPRGISGALEPSRRLASAAPSDALLRLLPGDAGLVLVATLDLPAALDRQTLAAHLAGKYSGARAARTVAVVWNPRGDGGTEVALAWPEKDARVLRDAFTGPNKLSERRACGHVVLASSAPLAAAMERACDGKGPSILNGPPAVAQGLRAPVSLGVNVNLGVALSRLVGEAYAAERAKGRPSPEIEAARRLLEELPYFGLRGVAKDGALVPGGFRS
jgi:hypothetical protein